LYFLKIVQYRQKEEVLLTKLASINSIKTLTENWRVCMVTVKGSNNVDIIITEQRAPLVKKQSFKGTVSLF